MPDGRVQIAFYDAAAMAAFMAAVWSIAEQLEIDDIDPTDAGTSLKRAYCLFERASMAGPAGEREHEKH